jgi:hypothetical protein
MAMADWRGVRAPDRCERLARVRAARAIGRDGVDENSPVQPRLDADQRGAMTAHDLHRAPAV